MELAHHLRERRRAGHSSDDVVSRIDVRNPIAHGLVHRILKRATSGRHRDHLSAKELHPGNVQRLTTSVFLAHVNDTFETEQCGRRRRRDTMLASTSFGDDPLLTHPHCQERLAKHVVDFV